MSWCRNRDLVITVAISYLFEIVGVVEKTHLSTLLHAPHECIYLISQYSFPFFLPCDHVKHRSRSRLPEIFRGIPPSHSRNRGRCFDCLRRRRCPAVATARAYSTATHI